LKVLDSNNIVIITDICGSGSFAKHLYENGRSILTCGTDCEKCWQEAIYEHGIFSYYLIEALSNLESVDNNRDLAISPEELFNYVDLRVASEFEAYPPPSLQHPHMINLNKKNLTLFRIESTETNVNGFRASTSWWHDNYTYLWIVAGVLPIVIAITLLVIFKRKRRTYR
jgi:hypothetical protein